jgi:uncharacterized protein (TIGR03000 family)
MKRGLAIFVSIVAVGYFGYVRESEARCLRQRASANCCCAVVCSTPCASPVAVAAPSPSPSRPPTVEPPKVQPKPILPPVAPPTPRPKPKPTAKLYGLLIIDDANTDSGAANSAGGALVKKLLTTGIPAAKLGKLETLNGKTATLDRIRDTLAALPLTHDDTLVCYYSGAAHFDDAAKSYVLTPTGGDRISRAELRAELLLQKARLTVLLSDAPAHRVQPENVPPLPEAGGAPQLDALLFRHKGLVDVHASATGETAFSRGNEGGMFTLALVQAAGRSAASWPKFLEDTATTTERLYRAYRQLVLGSDTVTAEDKRAYREQPSQTPNAQSSLEQATPSSQSRLNSAQSAQLVVKAPIGARLMIDGKPTRQFGAVRRFETPDLKPGTTYMYTLLIETASHTAEERIVTIRAGDMVIVDFLNAATADRLAAR